MTGKESIDRAIAEGRITTASREPVAGLFTRSPELGRRYLASQPAGQFCGAVAAARIADSAPAGPLPAAQSLLTAAERAATSAVVVASTSRGPGARMLPAGQSALTPQQRELLARRSTGSR